MSPRVPYLFVPSSVRPRSASPPPSSRPVQGVPRDQRELSRLRYFQESYGVFLFCEFGVGSFVEEGLSKKSILLSKSRSIVERVLVDLDLVGLVPRPSGVPLVPRG